MDRRQQFLVEFLGALGAKELRDLEVTSSAVSGTVVYDRNNPEEQQEFRWAMAPADAPPTAVIRLAALIRSAGLLDGDKLIATRQELFAHFNAIMDSECSAEQFTAALESLLQIQVPMLDDGVESDYYFIQE